MLSAVHVGPSRAVQQDCELELHTTEQAVAQSQRFGNRDPDSSDDGQIVAAGGPAKMYTRANSRPMTGTLRTRCLAVFEPQSASDIVVCVAAAVDNDDKAVS